MRDLRLLAVATFISAAGDFVALVALALHVEETTGSAPAVSALFAATMLPAVLLARAAGALADHVESARLLALASVGASGVAVGLAFAGGLAGVLALSLALAGCMAVAQPAEFALVPVARGPRDAVRANGVVESARYAGFAAGPAIAGVAVAVGGTKLALLLDAASFMAIAGLVALMGARRPPEPCVRETAAGGFAALWGDGVLRPVLTGAIGALTLMSMTLTAEVFYVKDELGAGELGYALITAVWMAAMCLGATRLAPRVAVPAMAATALAAVAVQGGAIGATTIWPVLAAAVVGHFVGGVAHGMKNTLLRTLIQARVPASGHGRAYAAYNAVRNVAELGALATAGGVVAALGGRGALAVAGFGSAAAALAALAALRRPRRVASPA